MNQERRTGLFTGIVQLLLWNKVKLSLADVKVCSRLYHPITLRKTMMQNNTQLNEEIKQVIPPLTFHQYKGQSGKIGVIGGSEEYTGAPYFAAISALKVGADLSHVFCPSVASPVIKSYSPELIVHPLLNKLDDLDAIKEWLPRLGSFVIGPGLGRVQSTFNIVEKIIADLRIQSKPIVIDADGLFLVTQDPNLVKGYAKAILTPNVVEFKRLMNQLNISTNPDGDPVQETVDLSKALDGVTVVRKGMVDIIARGEQVLQVDEKGSQRRCGGQGDLLSGSMATFAYWAYRNTKTTTDPGMLAAYAACVLTRKCAALAFAKFGRSTTTTDLIEEIHTVFDETFENTPL